MKSKKKYVVGFWIAISLVVLLAVAMVAVLSAFTAQAQSGFEITYTAGANVEATISATYKVGSGSTQTVTTSDGTNKLVFNTGDTEEEVSKSFNKMTGIEMSKDDAVVITYTIKNDSTTSQVKLSASASVTKTNLNVQYSLDNATWKDSINDPTVIPANGLSIAVGGTKYVYIKITVATKTQSASFDGNFNFYLTTVL